MKTYEQMLEELKPYIAGKKVLEIGTGGGRLAFDLAGVASEFVAIDTDKRVIEENSKKNKFKNLKFIEMDVFKMNYTDSTFDVVIEENVLHEIPYELQEKMLKECLRVLKDKKRLILIEDNVVNISNDLFRVFDPNEHHDKRIAKTLNTLDKFLKANKFNTLIIGEMCAVQKFESVEDMNNKMLRCWDDIKIPKDTEEKEQMCVQINNIFKKYKSFDNLTKTSYLTYWVFEQNI